MIQYPSIETKSERNKDGTARQDDKRLSSQVEQGTPAFVARDGVSSVVASSMAPQLRSRRIRCRDVQACTRDCGNHQDHCERGICRLFKRRKTTESAGNTEYS
jgi:hypothetical protein